jgi:hypothetical protein
MNNETWIIEEGGEVIRKKSSAVSNILTPRENLIFCFWVADYSMRNAGSLQSAFDLYSNFLIDGLKLANECKLTKTNELFELSSTEFEEKYFALFDQVCEELKTTPSIK